jgi:flagellin-like hook-associated protein FlgL
LSSGSKIVTPADDAGGLAVANKIKAALNRNVRAQQNVQNALSFMQVQDGALKVATGILDRMSELKTMSLDVTKNALDIANYDAEFTQLQEQLTNIKNEDFNGIGLFNSSVNLTTYTTSDGDSSSEPSVTTTRTGLFQDLGNVTYGGSANTNQGFFDVAEFNAHALYTAPAAAGDDTVFIKSTDSEGTVRLAYVKTDIGAGTGLTFQEQLDLAAPTIVEITNVDTIYDSETGYARSNVFEGTRTAGASEHTAGEIVFDDTSGDFYITAGATKTYTDGSTAAATTIGANPGEFVKLDGFLNLSGKDAFSTSEAYETGDIVSYNGKMYVAEGATITAGGEVPGVSASWTEVSNYNASGADLLTSSNALSAYTTADFQTFIQTAATARAQNGAEMQRLNVSAEMLQANHTNFEAAHSRLADVDIARESTQFAKNNILVQSATAMLSQANNLPSIALQLLQ